jgi:Domain of unknown function (DUF4331)
VQSTGTEPVKLEAAVLGAAAIDARVDITDHYVFQKPGEPTRTILILNVNPLAPTHANEFRHGAIYETLIDTDGDAKPNIAFRYRFSRKEQGRQLARATRVELQRELEDGHLEGENREDVLVRDAPVSFGVEPYVTSGNYGVHFFAGMRSDPFFFDLLGFGKGLEFTGSDFFVDKNVFSIALDIPNDLLGRRPQVGIWTRTLVPMMLQPDHLTQVDQMGRPAINTLFALGHDRDLFATTYPALQSMTVTSIGLTFLELVHAELQRMGGYSAKQALAIAALLIPDVLSFDYSSSDGFWNGRRLHDDVVDVLLQLVTSGKITSDGVGPHTDYLSSFPYLGPPHV